MVLKTHPEASTYMLDIPNRPNIFDDFYAGKLKLFVANDPDLFPSQEHTQPGLVLTEDRLEESEIKEILVLTVLI